MKCLYLNLMICTVETFFDDLHPGIQEIPLLNLTGPRPHEKNNNTPNLRYEMAMLFLSDHRCQNLFVVFRVTCVPIISAKKFHNCPGDLLLHPQKESGFKA